jgi:hypothetical protein
MAVNAIVGWGFAAALALALAALSGFVYATVKRG